MDDYILLEIIDDFNEKGIRGLLHILIDNYKACLAKTKNSDIIYV